MTSKERFRLAVTRKVPDRVPMFITVAPEAATKLGGFLGSRAEPAPSNLSNRVSYSDMLVALGNDAVGIGPCFPKDRPLAEGPGGLLFDEWGIGYRLATNRFGSYLEYGYHPLAGAVTTGDVRRWSAPDPAAEGRFDLARDVVARFGRSHAVVGVLECTIHETCWHLVGLSKYLMDLAAGEAYVQELMDVVAAYHVEVGKALIDLGADMVWTGDDFGTQRGMYISPELWRRYYKERMRHVFMEFKKRRGDVIIAYHSCGAIRPIIDDLAEIGLEVLNPIQPRARDMAPAGLKAAYGARLAFYGGIDQQGVMPLGSPSDVEREVAGRVADLAAGGGYIAGPAHDIQGDVPLENVLTLFEAVRRLGVYAHASEGSGGGDAAATSVAR